MRTATSERRERILNYIGAVGHVGVHDLARALGFSESTVRRDLRVLSRRSSIRLTHGGAVLVRHFDPSFTGRFALNVEAKKVVGQLAAAMVADGETIFMDGSTTCFQMVPHLKAKCDLTVVTHSARVALEFDVGTVKVILIGGAYRPGILDNVGPMAIAAIENMRGYAAFLGADGIGTDFGASAFDPECAFVSAAVARNAKKTIILVDHTKFRENALHKIAGFDGISRVVTDSPPSNEWRQFLESRGIALVLPTSAAPARSRGPRA